MIEKNIVITGASCSGKTRQANEIAKQYNENEVVSIDGRKLDNSLNVNQSLYPCNKNTQLVIIDNIRNHRVLNEILNYTSGFGVGKRILLNSKIKINPKFILVFDESVDIVLKGASFTRRFEHVNLDMIKLDKQIKQIWDRVQKLKKSKSIN